MRCPRSKDKSWMIIWRKEKRKYQTLSYRTTRPYSTFCATIISFFFSCLVTRSIDPSCIICISYISCRVTKSTNSSGCLGKSTLGWKRASDDSATSQQGRKGGEENALNFDIVALYTEYRLVRHLLVACTPMEQIMTFVTNPVSDFIEEWIW